MTERNYLINTTTISTTSGGTTIVTGNTQSASFVVALTMVRSGIPAGTFVSGVQTWALHYVLASRVGPYEMRMKVQRRNSSGVMQAETGYGQVVTVAGTYDDNLSADLGTWAANDQLAVVWEHRRPSGTGNKNGTLTANGASYVDAPIPVNASVTPTTVAAATALDTPSEAISAAIVPGVNLFTSNPSMESVLASTTPAWEATYNGSSDPGTVLTRLLDSSAIHGDYSLKVSNVNSVAAGNNAEAQIGNGTNGAALVTPGVVYVHSAWVKAARDGQTISLYLFSLNSGGGDLGVYGSQPTVVANIADGWVRLVASYTAPPNAAKVVLGHRFAVPASFTGDLGYVDAVLFEAASIATPFDGVRSFISIPTPSVSTAASQDANVTPTTVAAVSAIDTPTVHASASVTPTTVVAQAFVPASPQIRADQIITRGDVASVTAISQPTTTAGARAPPAEVAALTAIQTPTTAASAALTAGNVGAVTAVPTPTIRADRFITLSTVAALTALDTPVVTAAASLTTTTVVALDAVSTPTIRSDRFITVGDVAAQATVPTPSVAVTGDATPTAGNVAAAAAVPTPQIRADQSATVGGVAASTVVPTPAVAAPAAVTPTTVVAAVAVPTPQIRADAIITVGNVAAVATVPTPAISVGGDVFLTTATVVGIAAVPLSQPQASSSVTPPWTSGTAAVPIPGVSTATDVHITAGDVAAAAAVASPTTRAGARPVAGTSAISELPLPVVSTTRSANVVGAPVAGLAFVPSPVVVAQQNVEVTLLTVVATVEILTPDVITGFPVPLEPLHGEFRDLALVGAQDTLIETAVADRELDALDGSQDTLVLQGAHGGLTLGGSRGG